EISSKAKVTICCRLPSSSNSKSAAVRPLTATPFLSRTTTSTRTRLTALRKVGARSVGGGCCPSRAAVATSARAQMQPANLSRTLGLHLLEPEPRGQRDRPHRPHREDLAEGAGVDVGVDERPL